MTLMSLGLDDRFECLFNTFDDNDDDWKHSFIHLNSVLNLFASNQTTFVFGNWEQWQRVVALECI